MRIWDEENEAPESGDSDGDTSTDVEGDDSDGADEQEAENDES